MEIYRNNILSETILKELVSYALELIKSYNKNYLCFVSIHQNNGINITVRSGLLEYLEFNNDLILSITVYHNYKKSTVSSSDLSLHSVKLTIEKAVELVKYTSEDDCHILPDINLIATDHHDLQLYYPCTINIADVIFYTKNLEKIALKQDNRIINSEGASFCSHIHTIVLGNNYGLFNSYKHSIHSLSVSVIAQDKKNTNVMERDYCYTTAREFNDLKDIKIVGKMASERAISRLNAQKILTKKVPILFSSELSSSFFSHFIYSITGSNIHRQNTCLLNCLGKKIFPSWLNIVDNPHINKGLGSKPFDFEGVKTKKYNIIKDGILKTWLLDTYFSKKLNLYSTGHSGGIHNWIISGARQSIFSLKALLKFMYRGVYITELMGDGVNLITGDYSRGAVGFWVENGSIQYPISEITISSNLKDMWKNIIAIGTDSDLDKQIRCGSILLSEIQVSGK
ncbi:Metalloprotease PmbA [Buchnera aphidicola (Eriosoma grossulariae)]|uniref:metalloprotease PmbA n=1 Tax=Buchnera aphidicola TaxID=9 RepID=UPI003464089C